MIKIRGTNAVFIDDILDMLQPNGEVYFNDFVHISYYPDHDNGRLEIAGIKIVPDEMLFKTLNLIKVDDIVFPDFHVWQGNSDSAVGVGLLEDGTLFKAYVFGDGTIVVDMKKSRHSFQFTLYHGTDLIRKYPGLKHFIAEPKEDSLFENWSMKATYEEWLMLAFVGIRMDFGYLYNHFRYYSMYSALRSLYVAKRIVKYIKDNEQLNEVFCKRRKYFYDKKLEHKIAKWVEKAIALY